MPWPAGAVINAKNWQTKYKCVFFFLLGSVYLRFQKGLKQYFRPSKKVVHQIVSQ